MSNFDNSKENSLPIELSLNADCDREENVKLDLTDDDKEKVLEAIEIVLYFTRKYVTDPTLRRIIEVSIVVLRSLI